ncbi:MAG: PEP-CTERM sorting domain-containing protein [Deltaproteobacteria bacterium]|nr:PEP-CTERM sorting domain-containing protein [Deltaproteobacteria bacterium]
MKTLAAAALVAMSLMVFSPVDSFAGVRNGNGYNNECPTNGNNHAVPEPGTMALLGAAIGAIYLKKRKSAE